MLEMLKADIEREYREESVMESMSEGVNTDVRDTILDEMGEDVDLLEIDDELSSLVNKIPEYDEEKEMNKKLKRLAESYIPEYDL